MEIFKLIGDKVVEGLVNVYLGGIYYFCGDFEKVLEYYRFNFVIIRELENKGGEGRLVEKVGNIYFEFGDYNKVIECY